MRGPRKYLLQTICAKRGHELHPFRKYGQVRLPDESLALITHRCACGARMKTTRLPR